MTPYVSFPPSLLHNSVLALGAAVRHALDAQLADGSWPSDPEPRIFETAMAAYTLYRAADGRTSPQIDGARAWLQKASAQTQHPVAHAIEEWLRALALTPESVAMAPVRECQDAGCSGRAIYIHAVGLAAGAPGTDAALLRQQARDELAKAGRARLRDSQLAILRSAEIIAASQLDADEPTEALDNLAAAQSPDGGYNMQPATTALVLLALTVSGKGPQIAARCRTNLLREQRSDGTWRLVCNDVWDVGEMLFALRGAPGFEIGAERKALDFLAQAQNPDGGWSYKAGIQSDNVSTAHALLALPATPHGREVWPRAEAFLRGTQRNDGLWASWLSAEEPTEPDLIAMMISAVQGHGSTAIDLGPARAWLASADFQARETFRWYSPTGFFTRPAIAALGADSPPARAFLRPLIDEQKPDGGWPDHPRCEHSGAAGNRLAISTLAPAAHHILPNALHKGVDYLIKSQRADGSWSGSPIASGPRPLLAELTTETHAFAATALRDVVLAFSSRKEPASTDQPAGGR